jgi:hypothetical protein
MMIKNTFKKILAALSLVLVSASAFSANPEQYTCTLVGPNNMTYATTTATRKFVVTYSDLRGELSGDTYMAYRDAWNSAVSSSLSGMWTFTRLFEPGGTPTDVTVILLAPARSINTTPALANRLTDITNALRMVIPFDQLNGYSKEVRVPIFTGPKTSKWKLVDATVNCKFVI